MKEKDRMLIMRFSALGDVAMTIPYVYALAETYPHLDIHFVTSSFFGKLFINPPKNLQIHSLNLKKDYKGVAGILHLFSHLQKFHPQYVADLHNVGRTWIIDTIFKITGSRVVMLDKMRGTRKNVLKSHIPHPPILDRISDVFEKLGFPIKAKNFTMDIPGPMIKINHRAIGIAPFARYVNKTYPLALVEEMVDMLCKKGLNVYLFGGRGKEQVLLEKVAEKHTLCHSVAGKYSLPEELGIMKEMDLMVSMDSANHHLASLAGTRVISIWGATTPICGFMAYGQDEGDAVKLNISCQPCSIAGSKECPKGDLECLRNLSPQIIVSKILKILNQREATQA